MFTPLVFVFIFAGILARIAYCSPDGRLRAARLLGTLYNVSRGRRACNSICSRRPLRDVIVQEHRQPALLLVETALA